MDVKIGNMVNLFVKNIMNTKEEEVYSNHTGSSLALTTTYRACLVIAHWLGFLQKHIPDVSDVSVLVWEASGVEQWLAH